jgi:hypothetical protein
MVQTRHSSSLLVIACYPTLYRGRTQRKTYSVWDPIPELTITSTYVHFRVDFNTFTMGNPMPEATLTLCQSRRLYPPVRDFGFGHCTVHEYVHSSKATSSVLYIR